MLEQMEQLQKMGPIGQLVEMIPGMGGMAKEAQASVERGDMRRVQAIIRSMTPEERRDPSILNALAPAAHRTGLGDAAAGRESADEAVR